MKAGTTTLFEDLASHPDVFAPLDKEPDTLIEPDYSPERAKQAYNRLFAKAERSQLCFEASTAYTKRPQRPEAASRAKAVCGSGLKAIYLVRDPVKRIVSHHHHAGIEREGGAITEPLREAIQRYPELMDWTRYLWQITPWVDAFGQDQVVTIRFEDYISHRREIVAKVQRFLGLSPRPELINVERVANRSIGKTTHNRFTKSVSRNAAYRSVLRPLVPSSLRERMFRQFGTPAKHKHDRPTDDLCDAIYRELKAEYEEAIQRFGLHRFAAQQKPTERTASFGDRAKS